MASMIGNCTDGGPGCQLPDVIGGKVGHMIEGLEVATNASSTKPRLSPGRFAPDGSGVGDTIPVHKTVNTTTTSTLLIPSNNSVSTGGNLPPAATTSLVPHTSTGGNVTAIVPHRILEPGAGSPNIATVIVPTVIGCLVLAAMVIILIILLRRRKRKGGGKYRKQNGHVEEGIQMDEIPPQTVAKGGTLPVYAQVDKSKKRNSSVKGAASQEEKKPLNFKPHITTMPLPGRPPDVTTDQEEDVYELAEEDECIPTGRPIILSSHNDEDLDHIYEPTEGEHIDHIYEATDENEYAVYDVTQKQDGIMPQTNHQDGIMPQTGIMPQNSIMPDKNRSSRDGIMPDLSRIPKALLNLPGDFEEHIYESTDDSGHYEATDAPPRSPPPVPPPFRPSSLPIMKTPPTLRPCKGLVKITRPLTIAVDCPSLAFNTVEDDGAYLDPHCHDHTWSPYHAYDPVYEKGNKKMRKVKSEDLSDYDGIKLPHANPHPHGIQKPIRVNGLNQSTGSGSDSSVYECIEGDDLQSPKPTNLGKEGPRSKSTVLELPDRCIDSTESNNSLVNNKPNLDEEEFNHEYTALEDEQPKEISSNGASNQSTIDPNLGDEYDNYYEPYSFHQTKT